MTNVDTAHYIDPVTPDEWSYLLSGSERETRPADDREGDGYTREYGCTPSTFDQLRGEI